MGVTVPDLDEAVKFFVEVMGCEAFYKLGPFKADDDWMAVHFGVPARAEIPQMQLVRCGYGTNLELLQYKVNRPVERDAEEQRPGRLPRRLLCRRHGQGGELPQGQRRSSSLASPPR